MLTGRDGGQLQPWALERAIRTARSQARLRHASAKTTLDTYGHPWRDRDESAKTAIEAVFAARRAGLEQNHAHAR